MSELKKDHSVGAGTGATGGAIAGAAIGAAGGPVGMAIGAAIGAVAGAKAGDSLAEYVNPTEFDDHWRKNFVKRDYYNPERSWDDYAPAYGLGYHGKGAYRGRKYNEAESDLEKNWNEVKGESRLKWAEAKDAVRDGWHHVERKLPGDFDNDGR